MKSRDSEDVTQTGAVLRIPLLFAFKSGDRRCTLTDIQRNAILNNGKNMLILPMCVAGTKEMISCSGMKKCLTV